jgi:hypothetical protein
VLSSLKVHQQNSTCPVVRDEKHAIAALVRDEPNHSAFAFHVHPFSPSALCPPLPCRTELGAA